MKVLKCIGKTLLVFLPVILIWSYIAAFPVNYMDGEYSYFTRAKDYRLAKTSEEACDILILGDSRAKSGLVPEQLSERCMSLAEGGTTAVEAYYTLKDYLAYMGKPEKVILSVSPYHFTSFDGFWTRSVYFDYLSFSQAAEVIRRAKEEGEQDALKEAGGSKVATLLEYKIKSPTRYMSPVVHSLTEDRKSINETALREITDSKGFKSFVSWWPTSAEHDMEDFRLLRTLDRYYRDTIDLCVENGIEVYSVNIPLIADSFEEAGKIRRPFSAYLESLKADYPETEFEKVHIETELESYDSVYFDDADHLNPAGAERYTARFSERYLEKGGQS